MKKNYNFMVIGVLFMASIITELYFLLEFRDNITLIASGGIIVLLTTYLLFDWFYEAQYNTRDSNKEEGNPKLNNKLLEDILKFEKASYLTLHQLIDSDNEKYEEFLEQLEIYKEEIIEGENNAARLEAKYHREDIKYITKNIKSSSSKIAASIEKIAERSTVQEIIDGVTQSITDLEETVQNIKKLLERGVVIQNEYEGDKETKENIDKIEELRVKSSSSNNYLDSDEVKADAIQKVDLQEKEIDNNLEAMPSEILEKAENEENVIDNNTITNKEVNKEGEIEKQEENPNRQMSAEEIAAMFANESEKKETDNNSISIKKEQEEKPKEDPNKQMSAEEIAALFASMK